MSTRKQLRAILLLPGMVTVAIPATILCFTGIVLPPSPWNVVIGSVLIMLGLALPALRAERAEVDSSSHSVEGIVEIMDPQPNPSQPVRRLLN